MRRRDSAGRCLAVLALWAVIAAGLAISGIDPILKGDFGDPDAYLQLVKASQIVASHDWYDNVLPLSNWPHGEVTAWSRALDILLLGGAALLTPFLGFHDALFWFGAVFSPLCLLASACAAGWMSRPLLSPGEQLGPALLLLIQPLLLNYAIYSPNHHSLLFLAFIAACGFILRTLDRPAGRWPAILAGICVALGLWASVEFLVPLAIVLVMLGLLWLFYGEQWAPANRRFAGAVFVTLAILQPIERSPLRDMLTPEYDRMSIVHAVLALLLFLFWILVPLVSHAGGVTRRFIAGVAGIVLAAGALYAIFPKFFAGPLADVDPALIPFLVTRNADWQPIMPVNLRGTGNFLLYLGMPFICLFWIAWRGLSARRSGNARAAQWFFLFLLMLVYLAMATRSIRFSGYPEIVAVIALADMIGWIHARLSVSQHWAAMLLRVTVIAALICAVPALGAWLLSRAANPAVAARESGCRLADIAPVLNDPNGLGSRQHLILAEIHAGSEILYRTRHAVLATPMFRNAGILDAYHILAAPDDDEARNLVMARHVDLILLCPGEAEREVFGSGNHEDTLYNRLIDGRLPDWIQPIALPATASGFHLFGVKP